MKILKQQKFSLDKISIYSHGIKPTSFKRFDRLRPILLKETNNAYFERHPEEKYKQIGL